MLIMGLTGPTGAGKGEFARIAAKEYGAKHIDTDVTAREVVKKGTPCLAALVKEYGDGILRSDGSLDRATLGKMVFTDHKKLARLNAVTHPFITEEVQKILKSACADGFALTIIDAPLLFESGEDAICDVTVGVIAEREVRRARIMARDGIDEQAAEHRLNSGKDTAFFAENCDVLLVNNGNFETFAAHTRRFLQTIL